MLNLTLTMQSRLIGTEEIQKARKVCPETNS